MKSEWTKIQVDNLGTIITGKTPTTRKPEYWGGKILFVTPKDLQGTKHISQTERHITNAGLESTRSCELPANAVCVSCIGNIGYVGMTSQKCMSNQQINSIVANETHDPSFIYYLMKSLWSFFKNYEGQSTTLSILNKTQFSKIEVSVPQLTIQKRISGILSALDDKIELNNKINENLEQQAQLLYKQYFPYSVNDKLPDGWHVGAVGEIVEIHDAKRIPLSGAERAKMKKKTYPYYGAAALMDYVDDYIFDGKYLLLGEDGTVVDNAGYPILQYVWGQFWVNNHAHVLTGKLGFNVESLYMLFKHTQVKSIVTGAVQLKISQANLRSIPVVIPPENLLIEYNSQIEPMFALFRANDKASKTLTVLRDTLLPKLMNGEIDLI